MNLERLEKIRIVVMLCLCGLVVWVGMVTVDYRIRLISMEQCNINLISSPTYCSMFCNMSMVRLVEINCSANSTVVLMNCSDLRYIPPMSQPQIWTLFGMVNKT